MFVCRGTNQPAARPCMAARGLTFLRISTRSPTCAQALKQEAADRQQDRVEVGKWREQQQVLKAAAAEKIVADVAVVQRWREEQQAASLQPRRRRAAVAFPQFLSIGPALGASWHELQRGAIDIGDQGRGGRETAAGGRGGLQQRFCGAAKKCERALSMPRAVTRRTAPLRQSRRR